MFTAVGQIDFRAKQPEFNSIHLARLVREGEYSTPLLRHHKTLGLNGSFATIDFQQIIKSQ